MKKWSLKINMDFSDENNTPLLHTGSDDDYDDYKTLNKSKTSKK